MFLNKNVSLYKGEENIGMTPFGNVIQDVRSGMYDNKVRKLREMVRQKDKLMSENDFNEELKKWNVNEDISQVSNYVQSNLYSFTPAGVFIGRNLRINLQELSGIIAIPIENEEGYWLSKTRWRVEYLPYVLSVWTNAFYNGNLVFFQTNLKEPSLFEELAHEINYNLDWDTERAACKLPSITDKYIISSDLDLMFANNNFYNSEIEVDPIGAYKSAVIECKMKTPIDLNPEYFAMSLFERLEELGIVNNYYIRELIYHDFPEIMKMNSVEFWLMSSCKSQN